MLTVRLCICLLLAAVLEGTALAHARLVRSVPERDAGLAQSPAQAELWFNELLDDGFNSIAIFSANDLTAAKRKNFATTKPALDPKDRTHLVLKLPPLAPGEYVLEWRVLSRDGHSAPGRLRFRVLPR